MLFLLNCLPEDFQILHERKDAELLILSLSVNSWNFYTRIFPRRMNEQQPGLGGKGRKEGCQICIVYKNARHRVWIVLTAVLSGILAAAQKRSIFDRKSNLEDRVLVCKTTISHQVFCGIIHFSFISKMSP